MMSEPDRTESVIFPAVAIAAPAEIGWMGAKMRAPITTAMRGEDLRTLLIFLSLRLDTLFS